MALVTPFAVVSHCCDGIGTACMPMLILHPLMAAIGTSKVISKRQKWVASRRCRNQDLCTVLKGHFGVGSRLTAMTCPLYEESGHVIAAIRGTAIGRPPQNRRQHEAPADHSASSAPRASSAASYPFRFAGHGSLGGADGVVRPPSGRWIASWLRSTKHDWSVPSEHTGALLFARPFRDNVC